MALNFDFDQDVATVFNLITDPDFLVKRSTEIGELEADCDVEDYDDKTIVKMRRLVSRDLPAFLAKLFNPKQNLTMVETWLKDGEEWKGSYVVTVEGQPVTISADFSLKAKGTGSCYSISHKAKANIPLVGGKVEKFILANAEEGALLELNFAKQSLA